MNTKHFSITITIMVVATLLLSACGAQPEVEPTVDVASVMAASVQQTVAAIMATQNSVPTATPAATSTPLPLPTVPAASIPTSAPVSPPVATNCWVAGLVSETIPDGSYLKKGEAFTKEWRIINGGTCAWTTSYKFVFESGNRMGAPTEPVPLPENVDRNMSTTVKIKMTAPVDFGTYIGNWALMSDTGIVVGKFTVNIIVADRPFAVTSVSFGIAQILQDKPKCGTNYTFPISITADNAGVVEYLIYNYEYPKTTPDAYSDKLTFDSAGTKTFNHTIAVEAGKTDINIYAFIKKPNNQLFFNANTDFTCVS